MWKNAIQVRCLHTSQILHVSQNKKNKFYNPYIKQLRPRGINQANMVNKFVARKMKEIEEGMNVCQDDDENVEEELMYEAVKRSNRRMHALKTKELTKGAGPRMLTWDQMEQLRYLQQDDPERWDHASLAHAFQISPVLVKKILSSKRVVPTEQRENLDAKARKYQQSLQTHGRVAIPASTKTSEKRLAITDSVKNDSFVLNKWFAHMKIPELSSGRQKVEKNQEREVSWIQDEDAEFYEMIYKTEDNIDEDTSANSGYLENEGYNEDGIEVEEDDDISIQTNDGKEFFDSSGNFLYRVM